MRIGNVAIWSAVLCIFCGAAAAQQASVPQTSIYAPPQLPPRTETPEARRARWEAWHAANTDIDARIAMFLGDTQSLIAAWRARPAVDRFAPLRAGVTPERRQEALVQFASAFSVWQAGDMGAAEIGFRRGLETDPTNGSANFYMGDILHRRGDDSGARDYYERSVAFGRGSSEALRAEAAIAQLPAGPDASLDQPAVVWDAPSRPTLLWDCADCPELTVMPAGSFTMGSSISLIPQHWRAPGPEHRVVIEAPIAVGRFEVTRGQYARFADATQRHVSRDCLVDAFHNVTWRNPGFLQTDDDPAICMKWIDAQAYVRWLSVQTGHTYRLLTQAEWEFAAHAGTSGDFYWGADSSQICSHENVEDQAWLPGHAEEMHYQRPFHNYSCNDGFVNTAPVGSFPPNGFGLYDMFGNSSEWVGDCLSIPYDAVQADCSALAWRAFRGGAFNEPSRPRAADVGSLAADETRNYLGFRVARSL